MGRKREPNIAKVAKKAKRPRKEVVKEAEALNQIGGYRNLALICFPKRTLWSEKSKQKYIKRTIEVKDHLIEAATAKSSLRLKRKAYHRCRLTKSNKVDSNNKEKLCLSNLNQSVQTIPVCLFKDRLVLAYTPTGQQLVKPIPQIYS